MFTLILRWFTSRTVRQAVDMCRQVRKYLQHQRDLLAPEKIQEISKAARELSGAIASGEGVAGVRSRMKNLEQVANDNLLAYPNASLRENTEVFLVTGAVVLALRTFFFQPMAIPSGSAQPTLFGITSENDLGRPEIKYPTGLAWVFQLCWSGIHYYDEVAEEGGELRIGDMERVLGFIRKQTIWIGGKSRTFWFPVEDLFKTRAGLVEGQMIQKGEEFMKLRVRSGDHLFVNRMTYNFRRPRRGEIIVFSSDDIPGLIQNTHYIKRLIALGGEHVRIGNDRHVVINGKRLDASTPGFENVYGFNPKRPPQKDVYSGHVNGTVAARNGLGGIAPNFPDESTEFVVRPNHYLAFGDNTMNSHDGRAWGDFPRDKVVGKSSFVFWPISSRFGWGYR